MSLGVKVEVWHFGQVRAFCVCDAFPINGMIEWWQLNLICQSLRHLKWKIQFDWTRMNGPSHRKEEGVEFVSTWKLRQEVEQSAGPTSRMRVSRVSPFWVRRPSPLSCQIFAADFGCFWHQVRDAPKSHLLVSIISTTSAQMGFSHFALQVPNRALQLFEQIIAWWKIQDFRLGEYGWSVKTCTFLTCENWRPILEVCKLSLICTSLSALIFRAFETNQLLGENTVSIRFC